MTIITELEKLRLFLKTRVPYIAMLIGICSGAMLLQSENGLKSQYLNASQIPVYGEKGVNGPEEFEFSFSCTTRAFSSIEMLDGIAIGFSLITSAPAFAASNVLMSMNLRRDPRANPERTRRTFIFLFLYFNAYFWMFGAYSIYSFHWEKIPEIPIETMTVLGI